MTVTATDYHGMPAFALESDLARVVIVPEMGAKIASLVDKRSGREWLIQPATLPPPRNVPYGADYLAFEMYAWDEMFPTIHTDQYPEAGPYQGAALPDHGEVWPLAWTQQAGGPDVLALSVNGRVLPYRLTRVASLVEPDVLHLHYTVTNTGDDDFVYLWAAHPLFAVDTQTEIVLPSSVKQLYNVYAEGPWGDHARRYGWPSATTDDGRAWNLSRVGPITLKDARKFYVPPELNIGWAGLRQSDTGAWMRLEWDSGSLPYLGMWIDEGFRAASATVALEPTNGFYDGLSTAYDNQKAERLAAGQTRFWDVTVRLNDGTRAIDE